MPKRIQLSRKKGWRKPEKTVVVSRPSKWGNPYQVKDSGTPYLAVKMYREHLGKTSSAALLESIKQTLQGKDLACWCPLGEPCHADVLLEIANCGPATAQGDFTMA